MGASEGGGREWPGCLVMVTCVIGGGNWGGGVLPHSFMQGVSIPTESSGTWFSHS